MTKSPASTTKSWSESQKASLFIIESSRPFRYSCRAGLSHNCETVQLVPEEGAELDSPSVPEPVQHVLEQKAKTSHKSVAPRNISVSPLHRQRQSDRRPNPSREEAANLVVFKQSE